MKIWTDTSSEEAPLRKRCQFKISTLMSLTETKKYAANMFLVYNKLTTIILPSAVTIDTVPEYQVKDIRFFMLTAL